MYSITVAGCILGILVLLMLLTSRLLYTYWLCCKLCSKLPTYHGISIFNFHKRVKYAQSVENIPMSVYIFQIICGFCKLFPNGIFVSWIIFPVIHVYKANIIQDVIGHPNALNKGIFYKIGKCAFGYGLVHSNGQRWKNHRKLLNPAFNLSILKGYIPVYNEHAGILARKLQGLVSEPWIDINHFVKACAFDILTETVIGMKTKCQEGNEDGNKYIENVNGMLDIMGYRCFRLWTYIDSLFFYFPNGRKLFKNLKVVRDISKKIIQEKKHEYLSKRELSKDLQTNEDSISKDQSLIEILLEAHISDGGLSQKEIVSELNTIIVAGYDTVSITLKFLLYLVGLDQEVQENIIHEMDYIFEMDRQRMVTLDDINKMKYLECVIKETMRLYHPFPLLAREVTDDIQVAGMTIPKGSVLAINLFMLHRDPDAFPNPEKFDPERFFPENSVNRHPFAFIPFSAGARNCIGQKFAMLELKVVLSHIFRNLTLVALDPRDKIKVSWDAMLNSIDPIRLRVVPRHK